MTTRIQEVMRQKGITQQQLADALGVSRPAISKWARLGTQNLQTLKMLAQGLGVQVNDLCPDAETITVPAVGEVKPGYVRIPVFDVYGSCGAGCANDLDIVSGAVDMALWFAHSLPGVTSVQRLQIVSSSGDSMCPTIESRSMVIVDTNQTSISADGIYCLRVAGELYIKRIQRNLDGTLTLISDNPVYLPKTIDRAEIPDTAVLGRVVYAFNGKNI